MSKHPIQPVVHDERGVLRFKSNAIVRHLLDHGGIDMNALARMDFTREDREQFAQLIGYSLSGYASLSYASEETLAVVDATRTNPETQELDARNAHLREELDALRNALREPVARLYDIHPDNLGDAP